MYNELLFLGHIGLVIGFLMGALRLGRGALQALIALEVVLANLFVVKQMSLFGFSVTCSDVYAVGAVLGLNLLQEYWGREEASKTVGISFLCLIFFTVMSQVHLLYLPIPEDGTHWAFTAILSSAPRIAIASIAVYYIVQKCDVRFFGWLKNAFRGGYLPLRIGISLALTQLLDTVLFSFLGLYGLVVSIVDIIAVSFLVKGLIIGCSSPITIFAKRFLKHV